MESVFMRSQTTRTYTSTVVVTSRLENCIDDVSHWMSANRLKLNADKTELLWAGSRHGPAVLGSAGPSLQLKTETVMASDQVRVLGVTMSSLFLERSRDRSSTSSTSSTNICATCFYWLRQLRQVRRSLDVESAATLVHAFVTSHVDYCNAILAAASKSTTDKLQRVMMPLLASSPIRAEVRSRTHQSPPRRAALARRSRVGAVQAVCNGSSLSAAQGATLHGRLLHPYHRYCQSSAPAVRRLPYQLLVPRHRRSIFVRRAFSVAGPVVWNSITKLPSRSDSFC